MDVTSEGRTGNDVQNTLWNFSNSGYCLLNITCSDSSLILNDPMDTLEETGHFGYYSRLDW